MTGQCHGQLPLCPITLEMLVDSWAVWSQTWLHLVHRQARKTIFPLPGCFAGELELGNNGGNCLVKPLTSCKYNTASVEQMDLESPGETLEFKTARESSIVTVVSGV